MANYFNRKDSRVQEDASNHDFEFFFNKYKGQTTETVLKAVWNDAQKKVNKKRDIKENVTTSNDLVPEAKFVTEDKTEVTISSTSTGSKVVETDNLKDKKKKGSEKKEVANEVELEDDVPQFKSGRTPRMRELIAELGKDKAKVRAQLEKEGYTCNGSGFHSEWNRVSKSI